MIGALIAVIALVLQGLVLGLGSGLVWLSLKDWRRWLPASLTFCYYVAQVFWPALAIRGLLEKTGYPTSDALRYLLLVAAITAAVVLLVIALGRERTRRIEAEQENYRLALRLADLAEKGSTHA